MKQCSNHHLYKSSYNECPECRRERAKRWKRENPEKVAEHKRKYNEKHIKSAPTLHDKAHHVWYEMKERCDGKRGTDYVEKGIAVCERWRDFKYFLEDMGEPPSFEHTIDRLDNSKGYQPDNCRWATMKEQARNRTNNVQMTFNGETKCLGEWAEQYQISYSTIRKRFEDGWKPSRVLGIEPGPHLYTYNGESKSITEWAKHYNMPVNRLHYRLTNGWSFEDAVSKPCGRTYTYNGETMSVSDWAKRLNVTANVLFGRLNNGQTFDSIVEKILKSEK